MAHRDDGRHIMARLIPASQRHAPIVTVQDGAASALAWVGGVFGQPTTPLGVCHFGQSGSRQDLYRCMSIDVESILCAAFDAVESEEAGAALCDTAKGGSAPREAAPRGAAPRQESAPNG